MHHYRFPHYFAHKLKHELTELYASTVIANFALAMITLFEPIYFVTVLGWSIQKVLLFYAGVYAAYILLIPIGAKIVSRYGYAHGMLFSVPFMIGYWLLLFGSAQFEPLVWIACIFFAIQKSLYWPAFHGDLARFSDSDQRSREFSGISALVHIVFIVGPFVGGFISENFGVRTLLIAASAVYFTMFIPMFTRPDKPERRLYSFKKTLSYFKRFPREATAYLGYGEELLYLVIWPLFIYSVVSDLSNLGAVMAFTTFIATVLVLLTGKAVDGGRRKSVLYTGTGLAALAWFAEPFARSVQQLILGDSFLRTTRDSFYVVVLSTMYERACKEDALAYIVFFEQALSIGKLTAALIGIAIYTATGQLYPLLILAGVYTLFYFFLPTIRRAHA